MKQRLFRWLFGGFSHPAGLAGRIAGFVMAHRREGVRRSRWAVDLLDLRPTDHLIEVGCGPGNALKEARRTTPHVVGVDLSPLMVRTARRRSRATVVEADAVCLPTFADAPFDKALTINTHAFWGDTVAGFRAIHAVLRPGGTMAVVGQPRGGAYASSDEVIEQLAAAGFTVQRIETCTELEPPATCVLATA